MRTSYSIGTARRLGALLCLPNMWLATLALGFVASWQPPAQASARLAQDPSEELDTELAALLDEERSEAERLRRGGRCKEALRLVGQHLDDEPSDWRSLGIRGRVRQDLCEWAPAEADLTAAFEAARAAAAPEALVLGLDLSSLDLELGRATRALQRIGGLVGASARRDFLTGRALLEIGNHASAMEAFGEARVRMEVAYDLDTAKSVVLIDGRTGAGDAAVRIFTAFITREFGEDSFEVRRTSQSISPSAATAGAGPRIH